MPDEVFEVSTVFQRVAENLWATSRTGGAVYSTGFDGFGRQGMTTLTYTPHMPSSPGNVDAFLVWLLSRWQLAYSLLDLPAAPVPGLMPNLLVDSTPIERQTALPPLRDTLMSAPRPPFRVAGLTALASSGGFLAFLAATCRPDPITFEDIALRSGVNFILTKLRHAGAASDRNHGRRSRGIRL